MFIVIWNFYYDEVGINSNGLSIDPECFERFSIVDHTQTTYNVIMIWNGRKLCIDKIIKFTIKSHMMIYIVWISFDVCKNEW